MMDAPLFAGCALLALLFRTSAARGWGGPFALYFASWSLIFLWRLMFPMGLVATSELGATILAVGLLAVVIGVMAVSPSARTVLSHDSATPPEPMPTGADHFPVRDVRRLLIVSLLLVAGTVAGIVQLRATISAEAGRPFEELTRQEVLYYQIYGDIGSSPLLLLLSLSSILAALGVVLGRRHPLGYTLVAVALAASLQSPSRTGTITTAALALIMFLYLQRFRGHRHGGRPPRTLLAPVIMVAFAVVAIGYFNGEAEALQKEIDAPQGLPSELAFLAGPTLYATGNVSALSVAADAPNPPPRTDALRSIWLVPRVASVVFPGIEVPNPVAGYVDIPSGYNTYSMFGDLYLDFGLAGVALGSLLLGALSGLWHRRAVERPTLLSFWTSAVLLVVLFGGVTGYRLFWLDTATWIIVGGAIFRWVDNRLAPVARVAVS